MHRRFSILMFAFLLWTLAYPPTAAHASEDIPELDLKNLPIGDWMDDPGKNQLPWEVNFLGPLLRMDQRTEMVYSATISGKQLNQSGTKHDLFLINRVSDTDGEWLSGYTIIPQRVNQELPPEEKININVRALVKRVWQKFHDLDPDFELIENYPGFGYRWSDGGRR